MNLKIAGLAAGVALGAIGLGVALLASDALAGQVDDQFTSANVQGTDYCAHMRPDGGIYAEAWGYFPSDDAGTQLQLNGAAGNGLPLGLKPGTMTTLSNQINSAAVQGILIQNARRFADGGTP